jgi:hypothetical protein
MSEAIIPETKEEKNPTPTKFGLPFYQVPKAGLKHKNPEWKQGTDKRKNFVDLAKKYEYIPGPGKYEKPNQYKDMILGLFKGGERNTYIDQIFKVGKRDENQVSPTKYQSIDKFGKEAIQGNILKSEWLPVTIDAEYLGTVGARDFHQDIYTKVPSKKIINYHKPLSKGWKTKK